MWYVIQVASGQEYITKTLIEEWIAKEKRPWESQEIQEEQEKAPLLIEQCFIPMRERSIKFQGSWKLVKERLFPGYVFVVTEEPVKVFAELKQIPRFTKLLGQTDSGFTALTEPEIDFICKFGDKDHVSHPSKITVEEGNRVRILSGDLLNYEGQIVKINLHKRIAVVRIEFMGNSADVHLGVEIVEKVVASERS